MKWYFYLCNYACEKGLKVKWYLVHFDFSLVTPGSYWNTNKNLALISAALQSCYDRLILDNSNNQFMALKCLVISLGVYGLDH